MVNICCNVPLMIKPTFSLFLFFGFELKSYKYSLILLIGMFLVSLSLLNCNPDKPDPDPTDLGFFALGEAKDYVYFKPGTWWVYQNTKTGLRDSIVVTFSLLDTLEGTSKKWHNTEEIFNVRSHSYSNGNNYSLYHRQGAVEVINQPKVFIITTLVRSEPYEGEIEPFYYPFNFIEKGSNAGYGLQCTTIKDTMTINGKIYNDVAIFFIRNDNIEPSPKDGKPAKYYWAKNFGLIQKDLFDSKFPGDTSVLYHSWKLINSNIIQ